MVINALLHDALTRNNTWSLLHNCLCIRQLRWANTCSNNTATNNFFFRLETPRYFTLCNHLLTKGNPWLDLWLYYAPGLLNHPLYRPRLLHSPGLLNHSFDSSWLLRHTYRWTISCTLSMLRLHTCRCGTLFLLRQ